MQIQTEKELSNFKENIDRWSYGPANRFLHDMLDRIVNDSTTLGSGLEVSRKDKAELKARKSFLKDLQSKKRIQELAIFINKANGSEAVDERFNEEALLNQFQLNWTNQKLKLRKVGITILFFYVTGVIFSFQFKQELVVHALFWTNNIIFLCIYLHFGRKYWQCPACSYIFAQFESGNPTVTSGLAKCPMCFIQLKSNKNM
jgi:hypothetical protein